MTENLLFRYANGPRPAQIAKHGPKMAKKMRSLGVPGGGQNDPYAPYLGALGSSEMIYAHCDSQTGQNAGQFAPGPDQKPVILGDAEGPRSAQFAKNGPNIAFFGGRWWGSK